jgi:mRNA interferase MazF
MTVQRGNVILVDFPFSAGGGAKVRPALVVQNDRDNLRLPNTIVAQITSVTRRSLEPTQIMILLTSSEGKQSGLRQDSVVNTVNIATLHQSKILRTLGSLPDPVMQQVNSCLKIALQLP